MEVSQWIADNWFNILSAVGILGGLGFTTASFRSETKTRKIANLLAMTANHRELWKEFMNRPDLVRILDSKVNLAKHPATLQEIQFVNIVVLHMSSVYEAIKDELVIKQEGLRRDAADFFSFPIPREIWDRTKRFQNHDFVSFVEDCRRGGRLL